jgi:glyoxylase-like metal-dependent hydrolase (beta-lactamase superfamily II)
MRIERLIAGHFTVPAGICRQGDDLERLAVCPIPVYVIEAGGERILVDTGPHPGAAADADAHYGRPGATGPFALAQERSLAEHVDLATVTRVVLTHLHFDHAGGLALLPAGVPVVLQRREWEAAHDDAAIARNFFLPADYAGIADRVVLVDGDHDLLGDGAVRLLATPGHTPGHQSVLVAEQVVVGGDVTHYASGLDDQRFPVFADDHDAQRTSAERLRALREAGVEVLPGHDPAVLTPGEVPLRPRTPRTRPGRAA